MGGPDWVDSTVSKTWKYLSAQQQKGWPGSMSIRSSHAREQARKRAVGKPSKKATAIA